MATVLRRAPIADRVVYGVIVGFSIAPVVVSAIRLIGTSTVYLYADDAVIELQARAVGTHAVLLGPYSRFGFHHPEPALFYALALPYRLLGSDSRAILLGTLVINCAAVWLLIWVAYRQSGLLLAAVMGIATLLLGRDHLAIT